MLHDLPPSSGALPASAVPPARGLYDPRFEHDSCGVSFVVHIHGVASHRIVQTGLGALCSMEHRGATGAEPDTGDGAGILLQVPDKFLRKVAEREGRSTSASGAVDGREPVLELWSGWPWLWQESIALKDGMAGPSERPGHGFTLDEDRVQAHRSQA